MLYNILSTKNILSDKNEPKTSVLKSFHKHIPLKHITSFNTKCEINRESMNTNTFCKMLPSIQKMKLSEEIIINQVKFKLTEKYRPAESACRKNLL